MTDYSVTINQESKEFNVNLLRPGLPLPWVDVRNYSSFSAAVDAIGSLEKVLLIPNEQDVAGNKTVPANVSARVVMGGSLTSSNSSKVTFNGPFEAGLNHVFKGNLVVEFGPGSVKEVYPQWWGAKGGGADDTVAIQAALTASDFILLTDGTWMVDKLHYKSNQTIMGMGRGVTILKLNTAQDTPIFFRSDGIDADDYTQVNLLNGISDVVIRDMTLDGNEANQTTPVAANANHAIIKFQRCIRPKTINCEIKDGGAGAILLQQCKLATIAFNYIHNCIQADNSGNQIYMLRDYSYGPIADNLGGSHTVIGNTIDVVQIHHEGGWQHPITCVAMNGAIISFNTMYCEGIYGIAHEGSAGIINYGNTLYDGGINMIDAIGSEYIPEPRGNVIAHNSLIRPSINFDSTGVKGVAIDVNAQIGVVITENTVTKPTKVGSLATFCVIRCTNSDGAVVKANTCTEVDGTCAGIHGIIYKDSDDVVIDGNNIEVNNSKGVFDAGSGGARPRITSNFFKNTYASASENGAYLQGSKGIITGNTFWKFTNGVNCIDSGTQNLVHSNNYPNCTNKVVEDTQGNAIFGQFNGRKMYQSTAAPTAGTWVQGDICWNTTPSAAGAPGWVCTTGGAPGTWKAMSNLAA